MVVSCGSWGHPSVNRGIANEKGSDMATFCKSSSGYPKTTIQASQWWKPGDHPEDFSDREKENGIDFIEGLVVRYYRKPGVPDTKICWKCGKTMHEHG